MATNMKLSTKLIGGFVTVAIVTVIVGGVGFWGVNTLVKSTKELGEASLPSIQNLLVADRSIESLRAAQRTLLIPGLNDVDNQRQFDNIEKMRVASEDAYKAYKALPQTTEEAAECNQFEAALAAWYAENSKFLALARQLESSSIRNPDDLLRHLQTFRGDHYKLEVKNLELIASGEKFDGGDDATACAFGKWLAGFKTENKELNLLLAEIRPVHLAFHNSVGHVKKLMSEGKTNEAIAVVHGVMTEDVNKTIHCFEAMAGEVQKASDIRNQMRELAMGSCLEKQKIALEVLHKIVAYNTEEAAANSKLAGKNSTLAKTVSAIGIVAGFALALAFGIFLALTISKALNKIIAGLASGAEQVTAASGQVASSSQQMAQGASEQASALEETSASLEEMASMTNQNADNANQANVVAKQAAELAGTGVESMKKMQEAIDRIKNSASETAKIIKTIDEIAFQTNLLALNAAVEAARAGEAGKGFAVVAEEVRNLARRSAEAAKTTADLIEGAQKNADAGVQVTSEVAKNLVAIKENAGKVATLIAEIAAASKEQSQGIGQVTTAVSEMDKVVQQNAANAEESASAAEELSSQAEEVNGMVSDLNAIVTGSTTMAPTARRQIKAPVVQASRVLAHKALPAAKAQIQTRVRPEAVIPLDDKDLKEF